MSAPPAGAAAAAAAHGGAGGPGGPGGMHMSPFGPPQSGNEGGVLVGFAAASIVLAAIAGGMRAARNVATKSFKAEDILIILSFLLILSYDLLVAISVKWGAGQHMSNLPMSDLKMAAELPVDAAPLSSATIMCAKISVGLTLLHLDIGKTYMSLILLAIFVSFAGNIQHIVIVGGTCRPTLTNPTGEYPGSHCIPVSDVAVATYVQGASNVAADILLVAVPLYFLRKVKLGGRDITAMSILIGFMLASTVVSSVKMSDIPHFLKDAKDVSWVSLPLEVYSICESTLCIIAACLPAMRQLLGNRFPRWFALRRHKKGGNTTNGASTDVDRQMSTVDGLKAHDAMHDGGEGGIAVTRFTVQHVVEEDDGSKDRAETPTDPNADLEGGYYNDMTFAPNRTRVLIESERKSGDEEPILDETTNNTVFHRD